MEKGGKRRDGGLEMNVCSGLQGLKVEGSGKRQEEKKKKNLGGLWVCGG
jgi:hypothetical protein